MKERYYKEHDTEDYLMVFGPGSEPELREARAAAIDGLPSSVCTIQVSLGYLGKCKPVQLAPPEWERWINPKVGA